MTKCQLLGDVETNILNWPVESSGWSKEEIAKKLKTSTQVIDKFLDSSKITFI